MSDVRTAQPEDLDEVRALLSAYACALPFALDFQDFDEEVATLPGRYAPPGGALLVGGSDGRIVGCVGVRGLEGETCEMKRLYVSEAARGSGLGDPRIRPNQQAICLRQPEGVIRAAPTDAIVPSPG